jgi:dUTP pyrophosphatase
MVMMVMNDKISINFTRIASGAAIPSHGQKGDAGYDLSSVEDAVLQPFERKLIRTGIAIELPPGRAGLVVPRSGNAINKGLSLVNTPGLIDSNYRGELKIIAINLDPAKPIEIHQGDRIAQLVIIKADDADFTEVETLSNTDRGSDGFGSSGL